MHLYVHIPFCHSKCAYCDFYSDPRINLAGDYAQALLNEWQSHEVPSISTLYIGGGTPSALPEPVLERIISYFPEPKEEFTIEVNPEDILSGNFSRLGRDRRLSMGIQSLNDEELSFIGRRHTGIQALNAVKKITCELTTHLSLDLIYGLPNQTLGSWQESLDRVLELRPEHLSCYLLSYEPGTRLWAMLQAGKIKQANEELIEAMYLYLIQAAREAGYDHYEISNFALPGYQAIHNSSYWSGEPYIGLGPGAHSFSGRERSYNPANLSDYLNKKGLNTQIIEPESAENLYNDRIICSLRTSQGLELNKYPNREEILALANPWLQQGKMILAGENLKIEEKAWLISNAIMEDFIRL